LTGTSIVSRTTSPGCQRLGGSVEPLTAAGRSPEIHDDHSLPGFSPEVGGQPDGKAGAPHTLDRAVDGHDGGLGELPRVLFGPQPSREQAAQVQDERWNLVDDLIEIFFLQPQHQGVVHRLHRG
jgi:hypothetical protein